MRNDHYWSNAIRIGMHVYDVADPRHIGRVERIAWSTTARVRWQDTGWLSDVPVTDLRKANWRDL